MSLLNNGRRFLASLAPARGQRPPAEAYYGYILALLIGYWIADLATLSVRPALLPTQPPPMKPARATPNTFTDVNKYNTIKDRNIFNEDGVIPPKLSGDSEVNLAEMTPVLSNLPLKLEGTLVHANPKKSVASINVRSKNATDAFMVDDDIEGLARMVAIERRRAIFRNNNNGRLEYIEIPKDTAVSFGVKDPQVAGEEVQRKGEFEFTMRRSDITKYTSDLGSILQQARMVPNVAPGSGGRVDGFRFVAIQPNSIYEKLGFKPMDIIKKVNGEEVNSPTKAMELYNALRSEGRIQLSVERNGREETFRYDITD